MPSPVSIINTLLKYSESPDQPLPKPKDTSVCSVLAWVDLCSALQVSESPFLRSSAWTRSRHHPRREVFMRIRGCPWPSQRSWAVCAFCDFFQTCFLPTFQISPLEMAGNPVGLWPSTDTSPVEQIWRENSRCTSQNPSKRERGTWDRAIWNYQVNTSWKCHLWIKKICLFINQHTWPFYYCSSKVVLS